MNKLDIGLNPPDIVILKMMKINHMVLDALSNVSHHNDYKIYFITYIRMHSFISIILDGVLSSYQHVGMVIVTYTCLRTEGK